MAKCSSCGGSGSCQCIIQGGQDGGVNSTPSTTVSGGGGSSNPYSIALAQATDSTFVPTIAGLTIGAGGSVATRSDRVGKEVTYAVTLTLGTGFVLPATLIVPLPPTLPMRAAASANRVLALGHLYDLSATANFAGLVSGNGNATAVQLNAFGANGALGSLTGGTPFVFAVGDTLGFTHKYTTA